MSNTHLKSVSAKKPRVLAVEDEATSRAILMSLLEDLGYDVLEAQDGEEALSLLEREAEGIDVIVLDKMMPNMNGLEVVAHLKDEPKARHIPIVMVTGSTKPEEVKEGIDAGVFYYLAKPYEEDVFKSVITSAMREADRRSSLKSELKKHQTSFNFIDRAEFTLHTVEEAEDLACFIANCFPNPDVALPGLAGLLVNAVEHGSLEIGYKAKTDYLKKGTLQQEIALREDMPEYAGRSVRVELTRGEGQVQVRIEDEGPGFKWAKYLDIDPARALDTHGRGIAQANKISFDELHYNDKGNVVSAISKTGSGIQW